MSLVTRYSRIFDCTNRQNDGRLLHILSSVHNNIEILYNYAENGETHQVKKLLFFALCRMFKKNKSGKDGEICKNHHTLYEKIKEHKKRYSNVG